MEKFKSFTENLMKVILVPDESSDSISNVEPEKTHPDVFSQTAADYLGNYTDEESCCNGEPEMSPIDQMDSDGVEQSEGSVSVSEENSGLKISFNGLEFTLPSEVVAKIKEVWGVDCEEGEDDDSSKESDEDFEEVKENPFEDDDDDDDDDDDETIKESDKSKSHHQLNAGKAAQVTNYIKKRKKEGIGHEEAKKEAYKKFGKKGYTPEKED